MKKLPIGIQSIEKILGEGEYLYVDKTGFIKSLIDEGAPYFFMSRPRRFGKSLFLNTLEEIFKGNKELFRGLQIYQSDYDWREHPVLHFDFAKILSETSKDFKKGLEDAIDDFSNLHEIPTEGSSYLSKLNRLITSLSEKNQVVVLVDEYDSAIINHLKNVEVAEKNRDLLKAFFGTLKSLDRYLKFTFITGVSKFSQVSLFSGPNNLTDITMDPKYAGMMGYTEEELKENFQDYIQDIAKNRNKHGNSVSEQDIVEEIRTWYNGYRFSESELSVYNPYSTLRYLSAKKAESYWYSTGTPSFLIDEAKKHPQSVVPLSGTSALKSTLSDISKLDRIHLAALMFQTGYLTINGYNPEENSYDLDFPNKEVKEAFFNSLLQEFTEVDPLEVTRAAKEIKQDLHKLDLNAFFSKMNVHFAKMPYHVFHHAKEGFYQAVFFTFLETSGIKTMAEISTNIGRIDLMTETPETVCIFELKLDKTAEIALTQTERKKYRQRFSMSNKDTLVIGANFSSKSRNINDWKAILYSSEGERIREILPSKGE
ncbi:MAG: AAA family ATPase [Chlamydiia bacterium]|nr:AAA family ATPase [Chlamydiia bacterium]